MILKFKADSFDMNAPLEISSVLKLIILTLLIIVLQPCKAHAKLEDEWIVLTEPLRKFEEEKNCQAAWDYLWPDAKAGNSDKQFILLLKLFSMGHEMVITMPGHQGDLSSRMRDISIVGVHSTRSRFWRMSDVKFQNMYYEVIASTWSELPDGKRFRNCLAMMPKQNCADQIVKENFVPSFNVYAKEIDALIAAGFNPHCSFRPEEAKDISGTGDIKK